MDNQLQRLVELPTEQNELLKKHLVRLKFSLVSLLLLMTATCCGLQLFRRLACIRWRLRVSLVAKARGLKETGHAVEYLP
jgi:hypothetical protein